MSRRNWVSLAAVALIALALAAGNIAAQAAADNKDPAAVAARRRGQGNSTRAGKSAKVQLPDAAAKAVKDMYPDATVQNVASQEVNGLQVFVADLKVAKMTGMPQVCVTADGAVLSTGTEVVLKDVPEPAAAAISKAVGESKTRILKQEIRAEIKKEGDTPKVTRLAPARVVYEVIILVTKAKNLRGGDMQVAPDGTVIKELTKEAPQPKKAKKGGAGK